jgi:hypothetical protein
MPQDALFILKYRIFGMRQQVLPGRPGLSWEHRFACPVAWSSDWHWQFSISAIRRIKNTSGTGY